MTVPSESGASGSLPAWQPVSRELVADCRVFQVHKACFRHPRRETTADFFVLRSPDWVHVVARTVDDQLVLVRQFRFGTEEFSLEAPGGLMEAGEDPIIAARRELLEETGFGGGTAHVLSHLRPNPAIQQNTCHLVLLDGVEPSAALAWDEHEEIESCVLPVAKAVALARNGGITHSLSMLALLLFEARRRQGEVSSAV